MIDQGIEINITIKLWFVGWTILCSSQKNKHTIDTCLNKTLALIADVFLKRPSFSKDASHLKLAPLEMFVIFVLAFLVLLCYSSFHIASVGLYIIVNCLCIL